jgi:hypothetical protein
MKRLIIPITCISFLLGCVSSNIYFKDDTSSNTYLEQDRWDSDRINIKSKYGVTKGYIKPDRWESARLNVYDQLGRPTGTYLKKDLWKPERWNIRK